MSDDESVASYQAGRARDLWEEAVRIERTADPEHGTWYAIAGEMVGTLQALQSMTTLIANRLASYDEGRTVLDDEGRDPAARLDECNAQLTELEAILLSADSAANAFWSSVGHVGVEVAP